MLGTRRQGGFSYPTAAGISEHTPERFESVLFDWFRVGW